MKISSLKSVVVKLIAVVTVMTTISFSSFSQLDSVNVEIVFTVEMDSVNLDSLGNAQSIDVMNVKASIYDVDFMGEVIATVYDSGTNYPVSKIKMTAQEFIDAGQKVGSTVTLKLDYLDPSASYRVETEVRNFQGANFPIVITNYNN